MGELIPLPAWREPESLEKAAAEIRDLALSLHENAYRLGRRLLWVKVAVGHGNFLPWLMQNVALISERTARHLMAHARRCDEERTLIEYHPGKSATVADFKEPQPLPEGKFRVLYADPPWRYEQFESFREGASTHYTTMSTGEICVLPVRDLAADDSVLFLWATGPLLDQAVDVLRAWGFCHKQQMVWRKNRAPGIGWWVKGLHEYLLMGTRGAPGAPRGPWRDPLIEAPVTRHSEKPALVYDMIESMFPGPYLELFARHQRPGWTAWGNEVVPAPELTA